MNTACATLVGIILQVLAAAYLLFCSWRASTTLGKYKSEVTYGELGPKIDALGQEIGGQFRHQLIGFLLLLVGSGFLLYAALTA